jgi:hypothetical protein
MDPAEIRWGKNWRFQRESGTLVQPLKNRHITKCRLSLRHDEFHFRVGNLFPNCQELYDFRRWRVIFKGLSKDRERANFSKTSAPLSLVKAFRKNLISAGSISLESTFKRRENMKRLGLHPPVCSHKKNL